MSEVMQGFPSSQPNQVTLANWRTAPYCHWAFHHVREIVPSAEIQNNPVDVWSLKSSSLNLDKIDLDEAIICLLYTSPSPRDGLLSRMPSSA